MCGQGEMQSTKQRATDQGLKRCKVERAGTPEWETVRDGGNQKAKHEAADRAHRRRVLATDHPTNEVGRALSLLLHFHALVIPLKSAVVPQPEITIPRDNVEGPGA